MNQTLRNLLLLFPSGGIKWLLRDEFTDTRAAGAVNGTPCTPGPGTRKATDTDGDGVSIGSGILSIANPNDNPGDPGYWINNAIVRAAGRMLFMSTRITTAVKIQYLGWDSDTAGGPTYGFRINGAETIYGMETVSIAFGPYAVATWYKLCAVLRASGLYYFVKGGIYTNWTLLFAGTFGALTPVYPSVSTYNGVLAGTYVRVPEELWLPTPAAFDTFSRADGALGSSETVGPDGQGVAARTWVDRVGTTLVATNKAQASVLDGGIAIATMDTGVVNAITDATLTRAGNEVGVVLRYVDADNYIRAIHDGTNCKLVKRVATAETDVISAAVAIGAGAIRVIPDGTTFRLYLNNAQVGATSTISDAALQTGTEQGLYSTNLGNTQDLLSIFARGSNGEYAALNRWSF